MKKWLGLIMVFSLVGGFTGMSLAADSTTVTVSANVVGTCRFNSVGIMAFGNLDPATGGDRAAVVTQPTFWCTRGATYSISDDHGLNESGTTHRVKHDTLNEYIPYTFSYAVSGTGAGPNNPITMDISGTIAGADYSTVSAGPYSDIVTLTITP